MVRVMVSISVSEWRSKHGLGYRRAAEMLGVSEMTVWRWEHGRKVPQAVEIAVEHLDAEMNTSEEERDD